MNDFLGNDLVQLIAMILGTAGGGGAIASVPAARRWLRRRNGEPEVPIEEEETIHSAIQHISRQVEGHHETTKTGFEDINGELKQLRADAQDEATRTTKLETTVKTHTREIERVGQKAEVAAEGVAYLKGRTEPS
jgi:hypothetical protein